jgi:hypothetical protein
LDSGFREMAGIVLRHGGLEIAVEALVWAVALCLGT